MRKQYFVVGQVNYDAAKETIQDYGTAKSGTLLMVFYKTNYMIRALHLTLPLTDILGG